MILSRFKNQCSRQFHGPGGVYELVNIAAPLVVSYACETVMMFTDRLFMSRLGGPAMSATMGGGLTTFTFTTLFVGIIGYANALVAQQFGAQKMEKCPVVSFQALLIALCAYPLLVMCIPLGNRVFAFAGIGAEQLAYQSDYFTITMFGTIIPLIRGSIGSFFSGIGRTRIIMLASGVSMLCNVGLNYLLIFGNCGFPALGIKGAAIGTVIAGSIGLMVMIFAYLRPQIVKEFQIQKSFYFDRPVMAELIRFGYPSGIEMMLNLIAFNTLVTAFHSCGPDVATAITITFNWDMVSFVPMIGLSIAVTSLAGRYYGAQQYSFVYRSAKTGMLLASCYIALLIIPYTFFTELLVDLFLSGQGTAVQNVRNMALFMVRLICCYLFCDGLMQVYGGALRGVGDTFWTMIISVTMHWTFALLTLALLKVFHLNAQTTWVAIIVVFFCFGPLLFLRFRSGRWEKQRVNHNIF